MKLNGVVWSLGLHLELQSPIRINKSKPISIYPFAHLTFPKSARLLDLFFRLHSFSLLSCSPYQRPRADPITPARRSPLHAPPRPPLITSSLLPPPETTIGGRPFSSILAATDSPDRYRTSFNLTSLWRHHCTP